MVYGIAYSPLENKDDLKEMGFAGNFYCYSMSLSYKILH